MQTSGVRLSSLIRQPVRPTADWGHVLAGRVKFICAVFFFRVSLDACYVFYMNPVFGTHFLTPMPIDFGPIRYLLSYFLALLPATFVPCDKKNFSGIFFLIALMFIYLPLTCMFGLDATKHYTAIILALLAIGISFLIARTELTSTKIPIVPNGEKVAVYISYAFVIYFIGYSFATGAVMNINFDFTKMYEYRDLTQEVLDVGFFSYLDLWAQKVFNPFILAVGIYRKNRLMIIGAILCQIFFFAVTQHRDHLVLPIVVYLASQLYVRRLTIAGLLMWSAMLLGALLILAVSADVEPIPSLIIRRAFFVPASLTFDWIRLFSDLPKVYWSDGVLGSFLHTRYSGESVQYYAGYFISHGLRVNLNVGLVGTGFAQAGYIGVILYAAILGFVVKIVNTMIHSGLPAFLPAALLFAPIGTAWGNADLPAALLTHGIFVGIVVMWLYGSQKRRRSFGSKPVLARREAIHGSGSAVARRSRADA